MVTILTKRGMYLNPTTIYPYRRAIYISGEWGKREIVYIDEQYAEFAYGTLIDGLTNKLTLIDIRDGEQ
jgi:hypothetical protein